MARTFTQDSASFLEPIPEPGSKKPVNSADRDIPEVLDTTAQGQIGSYYTTVGLCWAFGFALLPAYISYHAVWSQPRQEHTHWWWSSASLLSLLLGYYGTLLTLGHKCFGERYQSRNDKKAAIMLMFPLPCVPIALFFYGVGSHALIAVVFPQCLNAWLSLVWLRLLFRY